MGIPLFLAFVFLLIIIWIFSNSRSPSIRHVPGPERPSFLLGNLPDLLQRQAAETDFKWQELYGDVVRFGAPFGEERLFIADPKALQYIYQTSGYKWHKYHERRELTRIMVGKGLSWADGEDHVRQRRIMLPGFGGPETKAFLPVFFDSAAALTAIWIEELNNGGTQSTVLNIPSWISRATLDAIGHAAFDYNFEALRDGDNPLVKALESLFTSTFGKTTDGSIIFLSVARFLPVWVLRTINDRSPNPKLAHTRYTGKLATDIARGLVESKSAGLLEGQVAKEREGRDIMSLLVKANASEEPHLRLSDEELYAQMRTLIVAGQETSANTMSWGLFELARNPAVQRKLREEIRANKRVLQDRGESYFAAHDLEAMPYLSSVLKEILRLYPVAMHILRQSAEDDVLPLSTPITLTTGEKVTKLPVPKGLRVVTSAAAYNRNKAIFGPDAHEFVPERWMAPARVKTNSPLGVYANL